MSLDLNVYVEKIEDEIIPKWINRLNQFDMDCEIHPDFSFNDHSGFLPFKIKLKDPINKELADKILISGFELYKDEFDLQNELSHIQPKPTFFQKIFKKPVKIENYASPEIDTKLHKCIWVLTFNWGSHDSLELRMASLSSAIISELTNGICCYPADDIWYDNATIVQEAYNELKDYEKSLTPIEWNVHEFEGWND